VNTGNGVLKLTYSTSSPSIVRRFLGIGISR
jgi:hypothetical protein